MSHNRIFIPISWLGILVSALVIIAGGAVPAGAQPRTAPDPTITAMIAQVQTSTLIDYVNQLTGETPAIIGGAPYTFVTRETGSGVPIQKATQYAYEFMQAQNLAVTYQTWNRCGVADRNVVAEKIGTDYPTEIVLVTAHIDSTSSTAVAPGADDDASGTAGVMAIAAIMAPHQFQRTLRFVLFTGEEQGLCGSAAYASRAAAANEDIVAVYNLDMIGWNSDSAPIVRLHTRTTGDPGYADDLAIANTFIDVVSRYGLGSALSPLVAPDGLDEDDTYSFWQKDYPGILAIEDDDETEGDFNPYYHTARDKVSAFNKPYYTSFVKASVGTAAELAGMVQGTPTPTPTPVGPVRTHLPCIRR